MKHSKVTQIIIWIYSHLSYLGLVVLLLLLVANTGNRHHSILSYCFTLGNLVLLVTYMFPLSWVKYIWINRRINLDLLQTCLGYGALCSIWLLCTSLETLALVMWFTGFSPIDPDCYHFSSLLCPKCPHRPLL